VGDPETFEGEKPEDCREIPMPAADKEILSLLPQAR
jgi:hypothetical protein